MPLGTWAELLDPARYDLSPGVTDAELDRIEVLLGAALPLAVRDLYITSDGIYDPDAETHWIWPTSYLVAGNSHARELGLDPTLIAVGDNGCGEPFCLPVSDETTVYCFYPIEGESRPLAADLRTFWDGWSNNTIRT